MQKKFAKEETNEILQICPALSIFVTRAAVNQHLTLPSDHQLPLK